MRADKMQRISQDVFECEKVYISAILSSYSSHILDLNNSTELTQEIRQVVKTCNNIIKEYEKVGYK